MGELTDHFRRQMPYYAGTLGAVAFGGITGLFLLSVYYPEEFVERRDNLFQTVAEVFTSDSSEQAPSPD